MTAIFEQLKDTLQSSYALERELGRGGMATVYLARDLKHDRRVAIKVLDPELGAVLGVERFLSEIRVTANLQHPNLLPLFDSGDAGGHLFYVMPYVEGESLRARLERERQLPVDEAVRLAIALGNALDYAHSHGVIHRDLKPENILLQHGQPVIADFGIALAISKAGGNRVTQTGLSLGTPQYMSPEQATGDRVIDGRSDIYSLGAILYEMLAGEPPHAGGTVQATIAKVLTEPARPIRFLRNSVSPQVEHAIAKSLAKLPADRFANAGQFVRALEGDTSGFASTPATIGDRRSRWMMHPGTVALAALLLTTIGFAAYESRLAASSPGAERTVRFDFIPPPGSKLRLNFGSPMTMSPDGRLLAYVGEGARGNQLWIRDLESGNLRALDGTEEAEAPVFSPDGHWLVFRMSQRSQLAKVPVGGGTVIPLYPAAGMTPVTFMSEDSIVFSSSRGGTVWGQLYSGSLAGGTAGRFLADTSRLSDGFGPFMAPDGRTLIYSSTSAGRSTGGMIAWATLDERLPHYTNILASSILGHTNGRLIYATDAGAIMSIGFDLRSHQFKGLPVQTGENAQRDIFTAKAALSPRGDLLFVVGGGPVRPMLVDATGSRPLIAMERPVVDARYAPDGRRIAFSIRDAGRTDVWVYTFSSGSLDRLTTAGTINDRVEWSPDSKRILYRTDRDGPTSMWWQPVDGSGPAERLTPKAMPVPVLEGMITPDGRTLVFRVDTPDELRDILAIPIGGGAITKVLATEADELTPRISPDGRWMAYISAESGQDEVYVRPFPGAGGRMLVSTNGGREPLWSRDGKVIYYSSGEAHVAAHVSLDGSPSVTGRDTVAKGVYASWRFHPLYDVAPDGKHLLLLEPTQKDVPATIILNWAKALAARLGPVK